MEPVKWPFGDVGCCIWQWKSYVRCCTFEI